MVGVGQFNQRSSLICSFPLVNFLGPEDEFVTSGSDDGNFFIWHKATGELHGIYEGDGSVVNVIEGHPFLPLIAVSGIDSTVKVIITLPFFPYRLINHRPSALRASQSPKRTLSYRQAGRHNKVQQPR